MKYRIKASQSVLTFFLIFSCIACGISEGATGDTPPVTEKKTAPKVADKTDSAPTQTIVDVQAIIVSRWSKIKTLKANLITNNTVSDVGLGKLDTVARGTLNYMRHNGQNYIQKDIKTRGTQTVPGHIERKVDSHALYVCKAKTCYFAYLNDPKPDKVYQSDVESVEVDFGGQGLFNYLNRNHIPDILPSTTFEGEKVFVIQAVGKPDTSFVGQKILVYVSEKTGMLRRQSIEWAAVDRQFSTTYRNVEVNPKIDPKIFDYTPSVKARMIQKVTAK